MRYKDSQTSYLSHSKDQETSSNEDSSEQYDTLQSCETPSNKKIGKWTAEEDDLLRKYVPMYGEKQWRKISNHIQGRTSIQCLHRWTKILKPGLVKGPWTAEEDQRLIMWVKREGPTKWAQASNFIVGRSGKQCRERWFNNLNPNVKKGNWSKEEDELIFDLYQKHGSSWSKIAKFIPGRTENAIKNRFYSTLRRLAADKKKLKEETLVGEEIPKEEVEEGCNMGFPGNIQDSEITQASCQENTLYKLLQEKTGGNGEPTEQIKKENSPREERETVGIMWQRPSTHQDQKGIEKKILGKKDMNITQTFPEFNMRLGITSERRDDDIEFEKFLMEIDSNIAEDFLIKEFSMEEENNEGEEFEDLQQKILQYCQTNISNMAEGFQTIIHGNFDPQPSQNLLKKDQRQGNNSALAQSLVFAQGENDNKNFFQQNIHGINITAPIPITQIGGKKVNVKTEDYTNQNNNKSKISFPQINNMQVYIQNPEESKINKDSLLRNDENRQEDYLHKWKETTTTLELGRNNLLELKQGAEISNGKESEKKLTFLFQQLYSLEDLLKNAKNELMKLESTLNSNKGKNQEPNEEKDKDLYEKDLWDSSMNFLDEGVEQIVKKRKYSS